MCPENEREWERINDKKVKKPLPESDPDPGSDSEDEDQQQNRENAIASVDAVENLVVLDSAIHILETADRADGDDSKTHPFVVHGVPICDLAKSIFTKKRRQLSPLQYLDDETIKRIAIAVGTNVLSQELCASQKTKEAKFKDVELAIVHFVKKNYPCSAHLQFQL